MKYYFAKGFDWDEANCYTLDYWREYLKDNEMDEIALIEATPDKDKDHFYCREFGYICGSTSDDDNPCGRHCEGYDPKNGKSGCCRHRTHCYETTDKEITLKRKP